MSSAQVLPQAAGYGVVLGIGFFFAGFMICLSWIQRRYTSYDFTNATEFASASHSVKPGLIASGIVSAWTWAATLLQSSAVAFKFGISGPWWYAAGATVQVLLFAQNAAKLKANAPKAHTFLEVIGARWGTVAHLTFLFFGLATNIIVSSMLILGGSATVTALTGMPTLAACFLIPVGVCIYTAVGGMRATLLCDYTHTAVLFAIILTFMFTVYTTSELIGSPKAMWEMLHEISAAHPVADNAQGSYLTMRSKSGLIFGVINVIGNFATVYNDQAYWQRAIASQPQTAVKGFLIGGIAWFSIPFGFATTMGLAAVALGGKDALSAGDVGAGLPAPWAAAQLLGKSGAAAMLILLFLAVTSAASAEIVATSSLMTYDVYQRYFNPKASDKQLMRAEHISIAAYGLVMGLLGLIFFYIGISMGWLYEFMGTALGSAVAPIALCIMSEKANKTGCIVGAWVGVAVGVASWLGCAQALHGELTIDSTFDDYAMLTGNLGSLGIGAIISVGSTLLWPDNYDWAETRAIGMDDVVVKKLEDDASETEKEAKSGAAVKDAEVASVEAEAAIFDQAALARAFKLAVYASVALFVILMLVIPLPLFFSSHVYPLKSFETWVAFGFIWVFAATFAVVVFPVFESRAALAHMASSIFKDITGKK